MINMEHREELMTLATQMSNMADKMRKSYGAEYQLHAKELRTAAVMVLIWAAEFKSMDGVINDR